MPRHRRRELLERLRSHCDRVVVGVFNEHETEDGTERLLESFGYTVSGRSERPNRHKPGMRYRVVWLD